MNLFKSITILLFSSLILARAHGQGFLDDVLIEQTLEIQRNEDFIHKTTLEDDIQYNYSVKMQGDNPADIYVLTKSQLETYEAKGEIEQALAEHKNTFSIKNYLEVDFETYPELYLVVKPTRGSQNKVSVVVWIPFVRN